MTRFSEVPARRSWGLLAFACMAALAQVGEGQSCQMERVSVTPLGLGGSGYSMAPSVSYDGRFVSFGSHASNLVPGDTNGLPDIFVVDRTSGQVKRANVTGSGVQDNGGAGLSWLSGDGRYVAFRSFATNLDPLDTDPSPDIYLHDLQTGQTVLVSQRFGPGSGPDGCIVSSVSNDGRYVAFDCNDDNILPNDPCPYTDVYVKDMLTGVVETISVGNQGEPSDGDSGYAAISADGRFVAFHSAATNWFSGNVNRNYNAYVRDRVLGTTTLVSHNVFGHCSTRAGGVNPSISADGRRVAFQGWGQWLMPWLGGGMLTVWQVYLKDLEDGSMRYVSFDFQGGLPDHESTVPQLSGNGRFIAWESWASDLAPTPNHGMQDIFLHDLETGTTIQISRGMSGEAANDYSVTPAIDFDGTVVAFASRASNLVPGDVGQIVDVFVRECDVASPAVYCYAPPGVSGCSPAMSFQGTPSATAGSGFLLEGQGLVGGEVALLLYGTRSDEARPALGGWLCLSGRPHRTPPQPTGGTLPVACDGTWSMDMNAWIAGGFDPDLVAGTATYAQLWCRDSADPDGGVLSDAVAFVIGP